MRKDDTHTDIREQLTGDHHTGDDTFGARDPDQVGILLHVFTTCCSHVPY